MKLTKEERETLKANIAVLGRMVTVNQEKVEKGLSKGDTHQLASLALMTTTFAVIALVEIIEIILKEED